MKQALIVFVKNNVLGKVKTRLAKDIGAEKASKVYQWLINYTKKQVREVEADVFVYYSDSVEVEDEWLSKSVYKKIQQGTDLGQRMWQAFQEVFALGYERAAIIGTDCYGLETSLLQKGFRELQHQDVVIGPANDGGYYFLGMNKAYEFLFTDKDWSTEQLINQTKQSIQDSGKRFSLLKELTDIDYLEDLQNQGLGHLI